MGYEFVDQGATADVEFEADGDTLEEMFESAALATFKVFSDPESVESVLKEDIDIKSEDLESLLYDFLENFLFLHDSKNMVFSAVKVDKIKKTGDGYSLIGSVSGENFDPEKHDIGTHVKAVTYHGMEIGKKGNSHFCKVILDI